MEKAIRTASTGVDSNRSIFKEDESSASLERLPHPDGPVSEAITASNEGPGAVGRDSI